MFFSQSYLWNIWRQSEFKSIPLLNPRWTPLWVKLLLNITAVNQDSTRHCNQRLSVFFMRETLGATMILLASMKIDLSLGATIISCSFGNKIIGPAPKYLLDPKKLGATIVLFGLKLPAKRWAPKKLKCNVGRYKNFV